MNLSKNQKKLYIIRRNICIFFSILCYKVEPENKTVSMRNYIIILFLTLFLSMSFILSEYTFVLWKDEMSSKNMSFIYGWILCNGKKQFFIQQGYSVSCKKRLFQHHTKQTIRKLEDILQKNFKTYQILRIEQARCYRNQQVLQLEKKKLLKNKKSILKIII